MKKFLTILIAAVALFALVSCNNGKNSGYSGDILPVDSIDASKTTKITFMHAMGQENQKVIQHIADNFIQDMQAQYGVTIEFEQISQGDYTTLRKTIAAGISAGDQPTLAQTYPDHVSLYLEGDAVRKLDDYISHPTYGLDGSASNSYGYIDSFWAEGSVYDKAGTIYSIPFNKSTEVMFYNKNIFDKYNWSVPTTWEDLWTVCAQIKQIDPKSTPLGYDSEANFFITLCEAYGYDYTTVNSSTDAGHFLFDNAQTNEMMSKLKDYYDAIDRASIITLSKYSLIRVTQKKLDMHGYLLNIY